MIDQIELTASPGFKEIHSRRNFKVHQFFEPGKGTQVEAAGGSPSLVSKDQALSILKQHLGDEEINGYHISDSLPRKCRLWGLPQGVDCWYITLSYYPNHVMLQSDRLICITKDTGVILYDGACIDVR